MHAPTTLRTTRLTLRPPTPADESLWVRLHRDPGLYGHSPHSMAATDDAAAAAFAAVLDHWREHGVGYHVVEEAGSGEAFGFGGLRTRPATGVLNLYYRLAASHHGRGLAREAARAWVADALEWRPDLPVEAVVRPVNVASVHTAQAAGLERAGTTRHPDDLPDAEPSLVLRAPRMHLCRSGFDDATREEVLDLWCAVNDAGGAVGFLPGAPRERVAEALGAHEEAMATGSAVAVLLRAADGSLAALGWWAAGPNPLLGHRRTAYRVMTDPARRGRNLGRLLMSAMHRVARAEGVELVELGVRGGTGTEEFYGRLGYREVGRLAGGIRVAPDDERDDIWMARWLEEAAPEVS
ncbi:GNAT family N-acetyltransferase [Phycicoccus endophyticus]|uniref:GNAT family N-acetyltransferase n=1 Tax=Phycicoccus endophyticus TaxID=1690220 RepID=A0A7G9R3T9_9MICO|nr:GNAT family N-acetyltransferase [Phycicoccus endophyticus]NHI18092.1 GNAT family N-acetyltransferase [Phycicoccus endophyticus]QNN50264.1 GNAT family N-acetyltransferase [Phycicoccus endophyticus]GGL26516.1 hypothetical protein GCM10012283_05880 [Phycicoccus endophyticus]